MSCYMHIKHFSRGQGNANRAAVYLTSGTKAEKIRVLRGDPFRVALVADSLSFKYKYSSGVIAWHNSDQPTDQQINDVLKDYENLAFAGLNSDQYAFSAIQHIEEDGSKHVHVFSARCELTTGKSFNPVPPGSLKTFDTIRDYHNAKHDWSSPADPLRAKATSVGNSNLPTETKDFKKEINKLLLKNIEHGLITNRDDVKHVLERAGFEIARETKSSISLKNSNGRNIRLTGLLYERTFNSTKSTQVANRHSSERIKRLDSKGISKIRAEYQQKLQSRSKYNGQRYKRTSDHGAKENEVVFVDIDCDFHRRDSARTSTINVDEALLHGNEIYSGRNGPTLDGVRGNTYSRGQSDLLQNITRIINTNERIRESIKRSTNAIAANLRNSIQRFKQEITSFAESNKQIIEQRKQQQQQHEINHEHADRNKKINDGGYKSMP